MDIALKRNHPTVKNFYFLWSYFVPDDGRMQYAFSRNCQNREFCVFTPMKGIIFEKRLVTGLYFKYGA